MEVSLEGSSLVKSTRYLIVISFQEGILRPNRPVSNLIIIHGLHDTLQLTQEKEKSSVFYCVIEKIFLRVWAQQVSTGNTCNQYF